MGIIGWIKKEIESSSRQRQRRQSAPPPPLVRSFSSPNQERDEAYIKAITKFNEWRNSQRFERLNETKNASVVTQEVPTNAVEDFQLTDVEIDDDERKYLIEINREQKKKKKCQTMANQDAVYSNFIQQQHNKRLSLPNMKDRKKKNFQPSATFDEIEEFEQNYCQDVDDFPCVHPTNTPPNKFFRENSEPYHDAVTPQTDKKSSVSSSEKKKQTPKRIMGRGMLRRNKGKAPQPPVLDLNKKPNVDSPSVNFYNGNFERYEVNTASLYDEFVISSKAYKGKLRKEQPQENINSVGESASSGSLSSDPQQQQQQQQQSEIIKQRRLSPPYQTVINKHGDEVEYALPYNERDSTLDIPPLPINPAPSLQFEQIIDQNFKFLNSKLDFLNSQVDNSNHRRISSVFDPIDASFSDVRHRQNLQVTDLDKSNETGLAFPAQSGDIIRDLDALAKWSQNLKKVTASSSSSPLEQFKTIQNNIKIFNVHDIKYKSGNLRNSFSTPLEFSNGYFHSTAITLRSTLPNLYSISNFADLACKREFEILAEIKHSNIVNLMGISYDEDLRITSLVMEPFDYTLNHYLHQMDKFYSIQQTAAIIHQISNATRYLHENGYVHSNVSSHAVVIRENPFAVKLSSFELVTEILPRVSIGKIYHMKQQQGNNETVSMDASDIAVVERYSKLSKQHFFNRTSLPINNRDEEFDEENDENCYRLPYSIAYRRMFSMHYYQAPELLIPTYNSSARHVLPTPSSDIYGLGLLLWELINRAVPYVIFNHDELVKSITKGNAQLPMLDKSCIIFKEIFEESLCANASQRISDINKFITKLEDLHLLNYGYEGKENKIEVLEIIEPTAVEMKKTEKNIKNSDQKSKLRDKEIYFSKKSQQQQQHNHDPQKRFENALTSENVQTLNYRDNSKVSESILSSEIEPNMTSFNQQPPGILQNDGDALDRIRKTVETEKAISPKKPTRKKEEEALEMSKNSTMFQSFFDFNRLHTPKIDKDVIYERTSTLKKRTKAPENQEQKKSVKGLFDKKFEKMNTELDEIQCKNDFMQEIVSALKERRNNDASSFLNQGMETNSLHDHSRSFEMLPTQPESSSTTSIATKKPSPMKRSESDLNYQRFNADEGFTLPNTPIARLNKLRRTAWLSEVRASSLASARVSEEISKRSINFNVQSNNLPASINSKKYNVNIKIHRNDLDNSSQYSSKDKSTNLNNSSHVNIKLYNSINKESPPVVKINNVNLNRSSYAEELNKRYYPNMPELLSDVFQSKRADRSVSLPPTFGNDNDNKEEDKEVEESVRKEEENDENVVIPIRSSVRDTIKYIENTFNPMPSSHVVVVAKNRDITMKNNETQTDDNIEIDGDEGVECLNKASEAIQKIEQEIPKSVRQIDNFPVPTPTKITTKVTLNVHKITQRSSDVNGHFKQAQEQARHSICNNAEIIKRIQMHFQGTDADGAGNSKNEAISSSCSSLVKRDEKSCDEIKKHQKYFCRNCGFTMIPAEIMQKLRNSGRFSIASSESLRTIQYDENSQSSLKRCGPISETRSTEDLYIDDDFCHGILAANMELLPPPDFFDSIDFNIFAAEFCHTHEHDFDATLTEPLKQIEDGENRDVEESSNLQKNEEEEIVCDDDNVNVPTCDDDKKQLVETEIQEIEKIVDEPKVDS